MGWGGLLLACLRQKANSSTSPRNARFAASFVALEKCCTTVKMLFSETDVHIRAMTEDDNLLAHADLNPVRYPATCKLRAL